MRAERKAKLSIEEREERLNRLSKEASEIAIEGQITPQTGLMLSLTCFLVLYAQLQRETVLSNLGIHGMEEAIASGLWATANHMTSTFAQQKMSTFGCKGLRLTMVSELPYDLNDLGSVHIQSEEIEFD